MNIFFHYELVKAFFLDRNIKILTTEDMDTSAQKNSIVFFHFH